MEMCLRFFFIFANFIQILSHYILICREIIRYSEVFGHRCDEKAKRHSANVALVAKWATKRMAK